MLDRIDAGVARFTVEYSKKVGWVWDTPFTSSRYNEKRENLAG